ncbi:SURF1 family protein [Nocardioides mesophilus]|uniref:SURF1-like protein n=1 Tax=Nocardioides mesophilus TaxID=433659 RepID=A0A7G9RFT1_9ACTN|nr:SURF1 family protein [Nocardioides mesophilus]QNN54456.1 SURF1 family protein [Nocardioides mesophilus]
MVRTLLAPRMLALHALGVLAVTAAVLLGLWQYGAWQTGRELEARDLAGATPQPLGDVLTADAPFPNDQVGRPVTFAGRWLPRSTFEVSDRRLEGRTGRWLVTPVAVCADRSAADCAEAPAMLVVRGWLAPDAPRPGPPRGTVALTGWLQPGEGQGIPDPDPRDDVLPELRIASAIQKVDQDLYGGYVIARDLAGPAAAGLEPVTPASLPEPSGFTSLRNLLYALEWWVFGGFAVYLWVRWVRDELAGRHDEPPGDGGPDPDGEPHVDTAGIRSTS